FLLDRNTVTGLVLILIVMVAWAYFTMPSEQELKQRKAEQARQDSIAAVQADSQQVQAQEQESDTVNSVPPSTDGAQIREEQRDEPASMGKFSAASVADTSQIAVETPLYKATFTNVGAGPAQIMLKKYGTWNQQPVRLINDTTQSAYNMGLLTTGNFNVETDELLFEPLLDADSMVLSEGDSKELKYALNLGDNQRIIYTYTFTGDSYEIDLDISFEGISKSIVGGTVDFGRTPQLRFTEINLSAEASHASAYVHTGGELEQLKLSEAGQNEKSYNGSIDWVSTRTKFFAQIIKSDSPTRGALLVGQQTGESDAASTDHHYKSFISTDISQQGTVSFGMYVGPLSYNTLKNYNDQVYGMVDTGYSWLSWFSDPLVKYVIIPYFGFLDGYMSVGLAIIVFGILIKLILYPLTKKSYESMAAMKELQPKMNEIKEKYSDNPEKQQKATMKLYKEAGVNPLGGCLPNLLQLPILVTLWRFFQNSILIRQQEFLWASDLSAPDYIISLPFSIPFMGDQIAGFVLLMTAAMFLQSKVTGGMG